MAGYDPDVVGGHRCPAPTISAMSSTVVPVNKETIRALTRNCFRDDASSRR
jgi:hypothetical protein